MSQFKSFSNNFDFINYINNNNISPDDQVHLNKIIEELACQFFFDENLSTDHFIYILNNRNTIEAELIKILTDRINNLNIDSNIRDRLISNVNQFGSYYTHIDNNSNINNHIIFNYESDEEFYMDASDDDDIDSDDDIYEHLENLILDDLEMEHDINAFSNHHRDENPPCNHNYDWEWNWD